LIDVVPAGPASKIAHIEAKEVKDHMKRLKPNQASGNNSIDGKEAKALPVAAFSLLTRTFNAVLVLPYYPGQ